MRKWKKHAKLKANAPVHIRYQRRVAGGRLQVSSGLDPRVEKAVQREAARYNCTKAFVISVAVAEVLGIDLDETDKYK